MFCNDLSLDLISATRNASGASGKVAAYFACRPVRAGQGRGIPGLRFARERYCPESRGFQKERCCALNELATLSLRIEV